MKFCCEDGDIWELEGGINHLIETLIDPAKTRLLDIGLVQQAFDRGLRPAQDAHLSWRMPLLLGGVESIDHLHVESAAVHLGVLAQVVMQRAGAAEGTPIAAFHPLIDPVTEKT